MVVEICSWGKWLSGVEDSDAFKKCLKEEKRSQWVEKPLHGRFLNDTEKVIRKRMYQGMK